MSIFSRNLKALKKNYPQYVKLVKLSTNRYGYKLEKTKTFNNLITDDLDFYTGDPAQLVNDNLNALAPNHCRIAIFLGFALGYEILFYIEQISQQQKTEKIIIIEHDPYVLKLAMGSVDLAYLFSHKQITILLGCDEYKMFEQLNDIFNDNQSYYLLRTIRFYYNFQYFNMHKDKYISAMQTVQKSATHVVLYFGNDPYDSLIGYRNMFANLDEIINNPGINLLKGKFKNIPAVCIASGPSLNKNIDLLHGLYNKALLISADASLQPLLAKGLKPHLVTSLEREEKVVELFKNIGQDYSDVYLAACPVIYNSVYQAYKGKRLIVYRMFDHFKWLNIDRGLLEIKASPGNMNFTIAEYLGCNPIILIGQDLSIDGEFTNVTNTPLGDKQDSYLKEPRFLVKGNFKDEIETTRSLKIMLDCFIMDLSKTKSKVINATEGGAYLPNTEIITFKEAKEKYLNETYSIKNSMDEELRKFNVDTNDYIKVKENIIQTISSFEKMYRLCNEILEFLQLPAKEGPQEIEESFHKILEYKKQLEEIDPKNWQLYFSHIGQSIFINHEMKMNTLLQDYDFLEAKKQYLENQTEFFETIKGLLNICIEDLEGDIKKC